MNRPALLIGASALILAYGVLNAKSQEYPEYQRRMPPQQIQQTQELEQQGARSQRRAENDNRQEDDGRMMMGRGWRFHEDWLPGGRGGGRNGR